MVYSINLYLPRPFVVLLFIVMIVSRFSYADGDLDPSFGTGGLVLTPFGISSGIIPNIRHVSVQADGKIVAVGVANVTGTASDNDFALARYNSDGSLDTTFNGTGLVNTNFSGTSNDQAFGSVIQTDGKIVAVGFTNAVTTNDFALARYNPNGSLDTTFGTSGLVTTQFTGGFSQAITAALQVDGKILAAGRNNPGTGNQFALARYNTNGSLDTTFGTNGMVSTAFTGSPNDRINALLVQADGKIVAVGFASGADFALARYNPNGSLDTTFGTNGLVTTNLGATDQIMWAILQPDEKIVAAGVSSVGGSNRFALARYNTNGSLDATFGTAGIVTTVVPGSTMSNANSVVMQSDGKIVAVGQATISGINNFTLIRYNSDGSLDTTFGNAGFVTTVFPSSTNNIPLTSTIQTNDKIIAAGVSTISGSSMFALVRYSNCSTLVGSDRVLQLFNNTPLVGGNGRIAKLALLQKGFALCGNATFDSCFPLTGTVCLDCFRLTLQNDVLMNNISYFGSLGDIVGNNHVLSLAQSITALPNNNCSNVSIEPVEPCPNIEWGNLVVSLNSNITLQDTTITFTGKSVLVGNGNVLTLGNNSGLVVGPDAELTMQNITIDGVNSDKITCENSQSVLILENAQWNLDADYNFTEGQLKIVKDFYISGPDKTFTYQTNQISTIEINGRLVIGFDVIFRYAPLSALQNLLSLVTDSSQIVLKGNTFRVSDAGITLLKGILKIKRHSFLISEGLSLNQGIHFGDGVNTNNNLNVQIMPAAQLFIDGPVIYQNA